MNRGAGRETWGRPIGIGPGLRWTAKDGAPPRCCAAAARSAPPPGRAGAGGDRQLGPAAAPYRARWAPGRARPRLRARGGASGPPSWPQRPRHERRQRLTSVRDEPVEPLRVESEGDHDDRARREREHAEGDDVDEEL